jgi:hypothetical protein
VNGLTFITQRQLDVRLFDEHADEIFWCETCERTHPLRELRECRENVAKNLPAGKCGRTSMKGLGDDDSDRAGL